MKLTEIPLNTKDDFTGWCSREAVIESGKGKSIGDPYPVIITTDQPAMVVDWERFEIVREVLLMDGMKLPGTKQVPMLDTHSRFSTADVKGSVRDIKANPSDADGNAYFWSKAQDEWSKVDEGHLTDVSAGYRTSKEHTIELKVGEEKKIGSRVFRNDFNDGMPFLIRTQWELKEVSLVPIGADAAAKFRSELQPRVEKPVEKAEDSPRIRESEAGPELQKKLDEALNEINQLKQTINIKDNKMSETKKDAPEKSEEQIRKEERERTQGINSIAERFQNNYKGGKDALFGQVKKAVDDNWTVDQFRAHVFDNYDDSKPLEKAPTDLGMSEKELDNFSISRYINAAYEASRGDVNAFKKHKAEYELEVLNASNEKAIGAGVKPQGRILPFDLIAKKMIAPSLAKRAMVVGTPASGGYLVGTDHLQGEFVGLLRNRTIAGALGVRIVSGLKGSIDVPKQLTAGAFAWGAEGWAVTDTNMTFGQVTASPKEGKASQTYGRKLLLQSEPGIDAILNEDMVNLARIGTDLAVFHGAGGNAPTGVASVSGVGDFVGASLDWDAILEAEEDVAVANADMATLKWALNPAARRIVKGRLKSSGVSGYLMDSDGTINGYGSEVSNQISSGYMMFGDWSKVWLCDWSMFDLLVNPYKDNTGNVTVVIFVYADVAVSIASALTIADDVS